MLKYEGTLRDEIAPRTIQPEGDANDRHKPEYAVKPSDIAMKPAWMVSDEGMQE